MNEVPGVPGIDGIDGLPEILEVNGDLPWKKYTAPRDAIPAILAVPAIPPIPGIEPIIEIPGTK